MGFRRATSLAALCAAAALALVSAGAAGGTPATAPGSPNRPAAAPVQIHGRAAIVIDATTGGRLYGDNADAHEPIASTTKLMTALLTLERARPAALLTAPRYVPGPDESRINLVQGERMTVHDLLRALLLPSANDAAATLADGIAGSAPAFVAAMNARARGLGLSETHYANPIGLDAPGNYSSARDLARLGARLMRIPAFSAIVGLPSARLESGAHPRTVVNRNDLVGRYPFVTGIKTGHTLAAADVLVASARANGASVVTVVLGEPDQSQRDADSLALLRYGLGQFHRVRPVTAGSTLARANVKYYGGRHVGLVAAAGMTLSARRGAPLSVRVNAPAQIRGPIARGTRVGSASVVYEGRTVRTVALVTASAVPAAGFVRRLEASAGLALAALACLLLIGAALFAWRVRAGRGLARRGVVHDHHRHAQRGNRQDARRAELPARTAPPGGGAEVDGRRQGRQRRTRP